MAIVKTTITGKVLTPDGSAPTSGTIKFYLSDAGTADDAGEEQVVSPYAEATLQADGSLPASFGLVPNDRITPTGTTYRVEYRVKEGSNTSTWSEDWQVAYSATAVDINFQLELA